LKSGFGYGDRSLRAAGVALSLARFLLFDLPDDGFPELSHGAAS
jgi:hypothetical protein